MTSSTDEHPPDTAAAESAAAAEELREAFGDLDPDLDSDAHGASAKQPSPASAAAVGSSKLNIVEPLWFLRTDERTATRLFADDAAMRTNELHNFRVDKACWLFGSERYQEAIDTLQPTQPLDGYGQTFNSKESDGRCLPSTTQLGELCSLNLTDALSFSLTLRAL